MSKCREAFVALYKVPESQADFDYEPINPLHSVWKAWQAAWNARLSEELAAEREKVALLEQMLAGYVVPSIEAQLAAAQATIAQMREALKIVAQSHAWKQFGECRSFGSDVPLLNPSDADRLAHKALALQTNQDALHEALAKECERLVGVSHRKQPFTATGWIELEAAAHRARKEGK